jgi:hypothetical protein
MTHTPGKSKYPEPNVRWLKYFNPVIPHCAMRAICNLYIYIYLFVYCIFVGCAEYVYIYMYNPCITLLPRIDLLIGHPSRCMVIEVLIRGLTACLTQTPNCNACEDGDDL